MGLTTEGVLTLTAPSFPGGILYGDQVEPQQRWYETSTTQQYEPGTLLVYGDGRKFRYALDSGTGSTKGLMQVGAAQHAQLIAEAQATSGTTQEIGDIQVVCDITTGSAFAENALQCGQLVVQTGTASGERHKILANKVRSTDTLMDVLLETPLRVAWDATTTLDLTQNTWYETLVFPTTNHGNRAAGVTPVTVAASEWYWAQTGGPAAVITDAGDTLVLGEPAGKPGTHGTAGGIGVVANDGTDAVWGVVMTVPGAGRYATIWLTLD